MTWPQRATFASLCAWLVATIFMATTALLLFGQDFRSFYAAAKVFVSGGDPYDFRAVSLVLLNLTGRMGNYAYYSPPWFLIPFLPLAALSYETGRTIWMTINVGLWIYGLTLLAAYKQWPSQPWRRWILFLAVTYVFAWITWRFEQTGILMFTLLAIVVWGGALRHDGTSGAALALMLTKPTVSILIVVGVLAWLWMHARMRAIVSFCITVAILGIISLPLVPTWLSHLADPNFGKGLTLVFDGPDRIEGIRVNSTFADWLRSLGIDQGIQRLLSLIAGVVSILVVAILLIRRASFEVVIVASTIGTFWLAPYALQYDFPPLTIPTFYALRAISGRPLWLRISSVVIIAGLLSVPFWEHLISDAFWIVIGVTMLSVLPLAWLPRAGGNDDFIR
jgi:hypothetical protein